jgi:flagellar basal body-associated protein FliL
MPVLEDPAIVLPPKRKLTPSQVIMLLLYPVIFLVGLVVGLVIGIRQGEQRAANDNVNQARVNSTIIPNANTRVPDALNTNTANSNTFLNTNRALGGGDYLELDEATQTELNQQEQKDKDTLVDQSTSLTDIVRQEDLITIKYRLKAYAAVNESFPTTAGTITKLDRSSSDVLYQALKDFYGGSFNEPIDPEHPTYYYAYSSDGLTFKLTCKLVSNDKVFTVTDV